MSIIETIKITIVEGDGYYVATSPQIPAARAISKQSYRAAALDLINQNRRAAAVSLTMTWAGVRGCDYKAEIG